MRKQKPNYWQIASAIFLVIIILELFFIGYKEYNTVYDFGNDFIISKVNLDNAFRLQGSPVRVCNMELEVCIDVWSLNENYYNKGGQ